MVVFNTFWLLNLILCTLCVLLLFMESAFGICMWCKLYNKFSKQEAELCPGWACEINKKEKIQEINYVQIISLIVFAMIIIIVSNLSHIKWKNTNDKFGKIENGVQEQIRKWLQKPSDCLKDMLPWWTSCPLTK